MEALVDPNHAARARPVWQVYRAIFSEADNSLGTLQMLTNIEARLEELLSIIDAMPKDEVSCADDCGVSRTVPRAD